jgi:aminopeptidase
MRDPRVTQLATNLLTYSVNLQKGEVVYIEYKGEYSRHLLKELISQAVERGGVPFWFDYDESLQRRLLMRVSEEQVQAHGAIHRALMEKAAAFISIRGSDNPFDLADVPSQHKDWHMRHFWKPVHVEQRVRHTKWVVLRYPNNAMAQLAQMSQEAFEEFYFRVCTLDYGKMSRAMDPLVERMNRTDRVRIVAPGTDLAFSIRDIPAIKCDGRLNIPDGEVFTAPVKDSIQGTIAFNAPTMYQGQLFQDIRLTFRDGRIVEATAGESTDAFNAILDTDAGSRFMGEFAVGVNPYIVNPMKDILFDEKIRGSIHLAVGSSYDEAPNGNESAVHWDLVLIQTAERGGGELWFDDELVRKDGLFVVDDLVGLNPENLA